MKHLLSRASRPLLLALALGALAGCGGGPYVWVQELPPPPAADDYLIASGDVISVRVFNQENMSTRARVRADGKIAVPFIGEIEVRGKAPAALSADLETRFKHYVVSAPVTVTVEETAPSSVSVIGEVAHPGAYTIDSQAGVLQALAVAGGFTEYASRGSIYLLRRSPSQRIRFTYAALTQGEERAAAFRLRAGDVVVVE
jgi:polysaccharide export outer membrane protein